MLNLKHTILQNNPSIIGVDIDSVRFNGLTKLKKSVDCEIYYTKYGRLCLEIDDYKNGYTETYITHIPLNVLRVELNINPGKCAESKRNELILKKKPIYNNDDESYIYYKVYS